MQKIDLKILKGQHVFRSLQCEKFVSEMVTACLNSYVHINVHMYVCVLVEPEWFHRFSLHLVL